MNIALFGGTFDPIHAGHLRAAKAAARRFRLDRVLFIPAGNPPHKLDHPLTPFAHRFAMVALACGADPRFVPSLLEAPDSDGRPQYSISTVRKVRRALGAKDLLYFLMGVDAFLDIPHWREYRTLLKLVNVIVVSRPGFTNRQIRGVLPADGGWTQEGAGPSGLIRFGPSTMHILRGVHVPVASSDIRGRLRAGRRVTGLVPPLVEQYIVKEGLYSSREARHPRR